MWLNDLENELNKLIAPLNLKCSKGRIYEIDESMITWGDFIQIDEEMKANPQKKKEILGKYGISEELYDDSLKTIESLKNKIMESTKIISAPIKLVDNVIESVNLLGKRITDCIKLPEISLTVPTRPNVTDITQEFISSEEMTNLKKKSRIINYVQ